MDLIEASSPAQSVAPPDADAETTFTDGTVVAQPALGKKRVRRKIPSQRKGKTCESPTGIRTPDAAVQKSTCQKSRAGAAPESTCTCSIADQCSEAEETITGNSIVDDSAAAAFDLVSAIEG